MKGMCHHCKKNRESRPRHLCYRCHLNPNIRRQYRTASKFDKFDHNLVTLELIQKKDKIDATFLAAKIRDSLLGALIAQGLIRRPPQSEGNEAEEDSVEFEEWECAASDLAETMAWMMKRAGVKDQGADSLKVVRAELPDPYTVKEEAFQFEEPGE
jgi:hypothetical protein